MKPWLQEPKQRQGECSPLVGRWGEEVLLQLEGGCAGSSTARGLRLPRGQCIMAMVVMDQRMAIKQPGR